jgi:hypothetical protein
MNHGITTHGNCAKSQHPIDVQPKRSLSNGGPIVDGGDKNDNDDEDAEKGGEANGSPSQIVCRLDDKLRTPTQGSRNRFARDSSSFAL